MFGCFGSAASFFGRGPSGAGGMGPSSSHAAGRRTRSAAATKDSPEEEAKLAPAAGSEPASPAGARGACGMGGAIASSLHDLALAPAQMAMHHATPGAAAVPAPGESVPMSGLTEGAPIVSGGAMSAAPLHTR